MPPLDVSKSTGIMVLYEYSSLESAEHFRLLKIGKSHPKDQDNQSVTSLHFEIIHYPLKEAPPYETLSYTWGSPDLVGRVKLIN